MAFHRGVVTLASISSQTNVVSGSNPPNPPNPVSTVSIALADMPLHDNAVLTEVNAYLAHNTDGLTGVVLDSPVLKTTSGTTVYYIFNCHITTPAWTGQIAADTNSDFGDGGIIGVWPKKS